MCCSLFLSSSFFFFLLLSQYFGAAHASGAYVGSSDAGVAVFAGGFFNDLRLGDVDIFDPYNGKSGKHYTTDHLYQNRSNLHGVTVGKNGRWAAFGPGNIAAEAKITLDFYDGETGNWAHRKSHVEMVDQGVASVGNVAFFVGADGYADTFALDGDCSMFDDVVSSSATFGPHLRIFRVTVAIFQSATLIPTPGRIFGPTSATF